AYNNVNTLSYSLLIHLAKPCRLSVFMRSFISLTFTASELPGGNEQGVIFTLSLYAFTSR
ncbi:hypothetical protein, partial [Serratia nevei]|uniref:hypothetical protein n=1 Tax=Serratia nevei TaxID=2703794 RepID=UPI003F80426A